MRIRFDSTSASGRSYPLSCISGSTSPLPGNVSRRIAPLSSLEQAYYWSKTWQESETETLDALANGEGRVFGTAQETIRWLLSADE